MNLNQMVRKDIPWQQRLRRDISAPFFCLFALQAVFLLFCLINPEAEIGLVDAIYHIGSWFCLSWWICHDAAECKFILPMSYGFLILFAAPFYAPIYLFQTRGWLALQTLILFIGAYLFIFTLYIIAAAQIILPSI